MNYFGSNRLSDTPPVVKNLVIINVLVFVMAYLSDTYFSPPVNPLLPSVFDDLFALHYIQSGYFHWWQFVTHMFMHANLEHIFLNMFGLWMFGRILESVWGPKRFLIFYMVTGIGAALFYTFVNYLEFSHLQSIIQAFNNTPSPEQYATIVRKYFDFAKDYNPNFLIDWSLNVNNPQLISEAGHNLQAFLQHMMDGPTVGASGAVFGILLGFGMLFPNTDLFLFFLPIPIKAKWIVIGYGAIELYQGLTNSDSNVAHFAHIGGMIFGFILIKYWSTKRTNFY